MFSTNPNNLLSKDIPNYLERMRLIHKNFLDFINTENDNEETFGNFINIITNYKIQENRYDLKEILRLTLNIANYHFRSPNFISKIERILLFFKEKIKQTFSNFEIFQIFKDNKRILLFLFEQNIIKPDKSIVGVILSEKYQKAKYPLYFLNEISELIENDTKQENEKLITDDLGEFKRKRKIGENDSCISKLIRNDSIDEFISHVNQNCISLSSMIESSIYETNSYLLKKQASLIEYAAFFGSAQIFRYLFFNGAKFCPSLWSFAIHGDNPELISVIEENNIQLNENLCIENIDFCKKCLIEAIKCHHIEIADYILKNYIECLDECDFVFHSQSLKYYNFLYSPDKLDNSYAFYYLCKYDYFTLVSLLLQSKSINVNEKIIPILIFKSSSNFFVLFMKFKKKKLVLIQFINILFLIMF